MRIGKLAKVAGVGIDSVRYYEREGLLPNVARTGSGNYREYTTTDVKRIQFVLRAKSLGFSLKEILELLNLASSENSEMAEVRKAASLKLADVQSKIASLQKIQHALETLIKACPGHGTLDQCPILNALNEGVNYEHE